MTEGFVTRFAPSPTGLLHLGHAFSALSAYEAAREAKGRFLLRIEDIDDTRSRASFVDALFEDLSWIGVTYETPVLRQSEHRSAYEAALRKLRGLGLIYRCFKTRKEIMEDALSAPHGPANAFRGAPLDPGEETRLIAEGRPFAWRLSLERARERTGEGWGGLSFTEEGRGPAGEQGVIPITPEVHGDVVLARKDVGVAYHLAVVVDDARQGVTHIIRGEDLHSAAHIQRLLQALLELPEPMYRHHRLWRNDQGERLAKRTGAPTLKALREAGTAPDAIRRLLGFDDVTHARP
jgi:glutamyl-Q tRNA(Asp) synthetase